MNGGVTNRPGEQHTSMEDIFPMIENDGVRTTAIISKQCGASFRPPKRIKEPVERGANREVSNQPSVRSDWSQFNIAVFLGGGGGSIFSTPTYV